MKDRYLEWDPWYLDMCEKVGTKSNCLSRHIGALLVRDRTIISQGYNGPPRGVPHCWERFKIDPELRAMLKNKGINPDDETHHKTCPRYVAGFKSGEGLQWCVAGHAERNALINAARHGISTKGAKLYMDCGVPCTPCLVEIINAGIEEIIITKMTFYDASAKYLLDNSNIKCRVYEHLK